MLAVSIPLNPPIQYLKDWLIIGCCLLLAIVIWYGILFWLTRKRKPKTIAELQPIRGLLDLNSLKKKYLALIDECYHSYQQGRTDLKGLHRGLSMSVRYFVYEAHHFPAPRLTLSDLKRAPFPTLTEVVGDYYDKEFSMIEHGDPLQSVQTAKEMIQRWG